MPQGESFFMVNSQGGSQFWKGLHKAKRLFHWGAVKHVNSGRQTLFWHSVWLGASPLKCQFWRLFHICQDPDVSVFTCPNEKIDRSQESSFHPFPSLLSSRQTFKTFHLDYFIHRSVSDNYVIIVFFRKLERAYLVLAFRGFLLPMQ